MDIFFPEKSFAFNAPTLFLVDEIRVPPFPSLCQKAAQQLPVHQGIPTLVLHPAFCVMLGLFSVPAY